MYDEIGEEDKSPTSSNPLNKIDGLQIIASNYESTLNNLKTKPPHRARTSMNTEDIHINLNIDLGFEIRKYTTQFEP